MHTFDFAPPQELLLYRDIDKKIYNIQNYIIERYFKEVDIALFNALKIIHGGNIPTEDQLKGKLTKLINSENLNEEYQYNGSTIFQVIWWPNSGIAFKINAV